MDWCPARIRPHPPGVPADRQLRAVRAGAELVVTWFDPGGGICSMRIPAAGVVVRQVGCRCTANPRLLLGQIVESA